MTVAGPISLSQKMALAAEVVVAYAHVRWVLHHEALPRILERMRAVGATDAPTTRETDERLARAVRRTLGRLPADTRCLTQSLVLTRLLARRGRESTLVIGVSPHGVFGAHAWVERDGVPLLPAHERTFSRLVELLR